MRTERKDQCILISGESGAGKTEASKKILQYYAVTCPASEQVQTIKDRLLQSNPVLEVPVFDCIFIEQSTEKIIFTSRFLNKFCQFPSFLLRSHLFSSIFITFLHLHYLVISIPQSITYHSFPLSLFLICCVFLPSRPLGMPRRCVTTTPAALASTWMFSLTLR